MLRFSASFHVQISSAVVHPHCRPWITFSQQNQHSSVAETYAYIQYILLIHTNGWIKIDNRRTLAHRRLKNVDSTWNGESILLSASRSILCRVWTVIAFTDHCWALCPYSTLSMIPFCLLSCVKAEVKSLRYKLSVPLMGRLLAVHRFCASGLSRDPRTLRYHFCLWKEHSLHGFGRDLRIFGTRSLSHDYALQIPFGFEIYFHWACWSCDHSQALRRCSRFGGTDEMKSDLPVSSGMQLYAVLCLTGYSSLPGNILPIDFVVVTGELYK